MKFRKITSFLLVLTLLAALAMPVFAEEQEESLGEEEEEYLDDGIFRSPVGSALLIETSTGTVLYEKDADEQRYPASLTKIMTCMLVLEHGNLNDIVTVSETALEGMEMGSSIGDNHLEVGEQMRLEDMLYLMMLESANEATIALAEYVSGSKENFVALMNQRAEELGCTGTHFANPHGLHDEDHYTTANDLRKIVEKALENETFRTITDTATYSLPATNFHEARTLYSTNQLINKDMGGNHFYYSKASGVKTGFTTPAGRCLITTATDDNLNLLSILLKAETMPDENGNWVYRSFPETINLCEWGFENYRISTVMSTLYPVAEIPVNMATGAETVALAPVEEVRTLIEANYDPDLVVLDVTLDSDSVDAPVEAGQVLGTVTVSYEGEVLGSSKLAAITSVSRSEITRQASETAAYVAENWWRWLVGILLTIAVVIIICLILLQYRRRQQRRRQVAARRRALELQRRRREWHLPED